MLGWEAWQRLLLLLRCCNSDVGNTGPGLLRVISTLVAGLCWRSWTLGLITASTGCPRALGSSLNFVSSLLRFRKDPRLCHYHPYTVVFTYLFTKPMGGLGLGSAGPWDRVDSDCPCSYSNTENKAGGAQ